MTDDADDIDRDEAEDIDRDDADLDDFYDDLERGELDPFDLALLDGEERDEGEDLDDAAG